MKKSRIFTSFFALATVLSFTGSLWAQKKLFPSDFKDVCNGVGIPEATAYAKEAGKIHPILVFYKKDPTGMYYQDSVYTPKPWQVNWKEVTKAQLVACLVPTERTKAKSCEYDIEGTKYELELQNTKFETKIFEAKTGKELSQTVLDLKAASECPRVKFFRKKKEIEDPKYKEELIKFIKPFVQPQ